MAALVFGAVALEAQDRPQAEVVARFNGTWSLDPERSEPMPAVPQAAAQRMSAADMVGGVSSAGGGRGGRGGGGGGGAAAGAGAGGGSPQAAPRRGGGSNPYVQELAATFRAPLTIEVAMADADVRIAVAGTEISQAWVADGRKRQRTQVDGTILSASARWRGDRLSLAEGVGDIAELKRELRLTDNGATLEIRLEMTGMGPEKLERKLVYTRKE